MKKLLILVPRLLILGDGSGLQSQKRVPEPHTQRGTAHRRQFKLPDLLGWRTPV
jgi:hypothetical protein